jgi:hypothetical protein
VLSEIVGYFTQGYDLSSMEFDAINDLLKTASDVTELGAKLIDGKADSRECSRLIEKLLYTGGQLFGIPVRNIKNMIYGVTKWRNSELAYKWDSALYTQSYVVDLAEAVKNDDIQMATTILELAFGEKMGSGLSSETLDELTRLSKLGEKMLPSAISDTITVNGEEYVLSGKELRSVRERYAEAVEQVNRLVGSEIYKLFNDDERAKAVRKVYSLYKDLAYDSVLENKREPEMFMLSEIFSDDVLCDWAVTSVFSADKDENGKTIPGSKREKVVEAISSLDVSTDERLFLIAMRGYTLADGDVHGVSAYKAKLRLYEYIAGLEGLDKDERLALYEACGFEIVDGKVEKPKESSSTKKKSTSKNVFGNTGGAFGGSSGPFSIKKGVFSN